MREDQQFKSLDGMFKPLIGSKQERYKYCAGRQEPKDLRAQTYASLAPGLV